MLHQEEGSGHPWKALRQGLSKISYNVAKTIWVRKIDLQGPNHILATPSPIQAAPQDLWEGLCHPVLTMESMYHQ